MEERKEERKEKDCRDGGQVKEICMEIERNRGHVGEARQRRQRKKDRKNKRSTEKKKLQEEPKKDKNEDEKDENKGERA